MSEPINDSYSVDSSCLGPIGPVEYRCVNTKTGETVFLRGPIPNGTNNMGEFLAVVDALALAKKNGSAIPVYTDSITALAWVRRGKCKTGIRKDADNQEIFALIARAEAWLANNKFQNPVLKWNTAAWGEILADYGRKRSHQVRSPAAPPQSSESS